MLGGVDSLAPFITVNEKSECNPDCNFNYSIASFVSGRSYHNNLLLFLMQSENAHGYVICPDVTRGKSKKVIKSNPFPQGNDNCDISAFIRKQIDSCSTSVYVALIPFSQINVNPLQFGVTF